MIPAFDEEARLPRLLEELRTTAAETIAAGGFELAEAVIVDDGSSDATAELLREAAAGDQFVHPVFAEHRGKGAAVAAGLRAAQGDYALLADVDLSTPLSDLARLQQPLQAGADVVIGSRAVDGANVEAPRRRRQGGRMFNAFVRALTGLDLRDTQNGFKLMPTPVGRALTDEQVSEGFAFDVELLVRAKSRGLRIAEVPVTYRHDPGSRVRMMTASPRMLLDVVRITARSRRRPRSKGVPERSSAV